MRTGTSLAGSTPAGTTATPDRATGPRAPSPALPRGASGTAHDAPQHAAAETLRDDAAATIARDGVVAAAEALGVHRDTLRTWRAGWLRAPQDDDASE